jgi:hypothetical protein
MFRAVQDFFHQKSRHGWRKRGKKASPGLMRVTAIERARNFNDCSRSRFLMTGDARRLLPNKLSSAETANLRIEIFIGIAAVLNWC